MTLSHPTPSTTWYSIGLKLPAAKCASNVGIQLAMSLVTWAPMASLWRQRWPNSARYSLIVEGVLNGDLLVGTGQWPHLISQGWNGWAYQSSTDVKYFVVAVEHVSRALTMTS